MRPHELLTHSTIVLAVTLGAMGTLACTPPTAAPQEQATPRVHSIGFLSGRSPATRDNEFQQGLSDAGYVIGQSLLIEYRFADGDDELLARQAEELVNLGVEIVVASDTEAGIAAKRATASIPIVIVSSGDPVGAGLVNSLAYP